MAINSEIIISASTTQAERQIKKLEKSLDRIEDTSSKLLNLDKRILATKRQIRTGSDEAARAAKRRLGILKDQRSELVLQKRELSQVAALNRRINSTQTRASAAVSKAEGASTPLAAGLLGGFTGAGATSAIQKQVREVTKLQSELASIQDSIGKKGFLSDKGRRAILKETNTELKVATDRLNKLSAAQTKVTQSATGMSGAIGGVITALAAYGVGRFVATSFQVAAQLESQRIRLRALSQGFDDYQTVLLAVEANQKRFNLTQAEAADGFGKAYARLRPLGLTLEQVNAVYEGFNIASINAGTTAAEAAGAFTQLTQALGSGVLRGQELNSILEQSPGIARAIASELNTSVGKLKEFGEQGKINSEVVLRALVRVRNEGINRLTESMDTPVQKFKKLEIAGEKFREALADEALPAVTEAVDKLADIIVALEGPIRFIGKLANQTLGGILDLINAATKPKAYAAEQAIRGGRLPIAGLGGISGVGELFKGTGPDGRGFEGIREQAKELAKLRNQPVRDVELELMQNRLKAMDALKAKADKITIDTDLSKLLGLDDGTTSGGGSSAADTLARQLETGKDLSREFSRQLQLLQATEGLERELLQIRFDEEDRMRAIADAAADQRQELTALSRDLAAAEAGTAIGEALGQDLVDIFETLGTELDKAQTEFNEFFSNLPIDPMEQALKQSGELVAQALNDTIGTAIEGLVTGADDLNESLQNIASSLLRDIGSALVRIGIGGLGTPGTAGSGSGLLGAIFNREGGGPVSANRPYIVGEREPELFVPNSAGTIYNQDQMQSAMATYSEGNTTSTVAAPIRFESTVINGVEYVTREEAEAIGNRAALTGAVNGAKQGEMRAMNRLRQSRSTRSKIGL